MVTLLKIPKEDYKKTILYLFTLSTLLDEVKKNPILKRKKRKELNQQSDELKIFIEKYEDVVLKTV